MIHIKAFYAWCRLSVTSEEARDNGDIMFNKDTNCTPRSRNVQLKPASHPRPRRKTPRSKPALEITLIENRYLHLDAFIFLYLEVEKSL